MRTIPFGSFVPDMSPSSSLHPYLNKSQILVNDVTFPQLFDGNETRLPAVERRVFVYLDPKNASAQGEHGALPQTPKSQGEQRMDIMIFHAGARALVLLRRRLGPSICVVQKFVYGQARPSQLLLVAV